MAKKVETTKVEATEAVKSETTKTEKTVTIPNVLAIAPKRIHYRALQYTGFGMLGDLIKFTGTQPFINADTTLQIKKHKIEEGDFLIMSGEKLIEVVPDLSSFDTFETK